MLYKGSCHCGAVAYEVEGELSGVMECNCSICSRKGAKMWFVPRDQLRLTSAEGVAKAYLFNKHRIEHLFCPTCGIHAYGEGSDPKGNRMAMVNVRCLEGVDLEALPVKHFDGRSL
jgi:hypothetical protein